MTCPSHHILQKQKRAAWRRAADELLIDAIFGSTSPVIRDDDIARPRLDTRIDLARTVAVVRPLQGML